MSSRASLPRRLRDIALTENYLACGLQLVNTQKQPLMRFVGERSLSQLIGRALGGGDAACAWARTPDELIDMGRAVMVQLSDASAAQRRSVKRWVLPGDHCYLLDSGSTRWSLLQVLAEHLHATCQGEAGLAQAWAWDAWVMDHKYGKLWAMFAVLSQLLSRGLDDRTMPPARDDRTMPTTIFYSIHPCASHTPTSCPDPSHELAS